MGEDSENVNDEDDFIVDEETEEKIGEFNAVIGKHQSSKNPDLEKMSDDDKEREANKLACLISDMSKQGVITPMSIDPVTGQQVPLDINPGVIASALKYGNGEDDEEEETDS